MKKLLLLLMIFVSVNAMAQKPSVLINRGDTIETVTDTTWFYSYDTNFDEIKMVRLNSIYGSGGTTYTAGDGLELTTTVFSWDSIAAYVAIDLNTAKTTNATHSGDVAGSGVLTIQTDAVDIAMLSATGTPDNTTFLRGDNTWATPPGSSYTAGDGLDLNGTEFEWDSTATETRMDSIVTALNGKADTANAILASDTLVFLTDSSLFFTYGAGGGRDVDTTLMASGTILGNRSVLNDTAVIRTIVSSLTGSTDTLTVIGHKNDTAFVVQDTMFTLQLFPYRTITTSFDISKIAADEFMWLEIDSAYVGRKPEIVTIDVFTSIIKD